MHRVNKMGIEGTYINKIKATCEQSTADITLILKAFSLRSEQDKDTHSCHFYAT